ncbi:YqaJ viral recombinase family protein [Caldisericum sp.]|uniref:YqaJ viral recombinase family protein n=1 Tax=Caldisericum sp. TaxID=2499687 RepID=UPI003D14E47A
MLIPEKLLPYFEFVEPIPFEDRKNYITGSTLSTIIGANPYVTPFEYWNAVVNNVEPQLTDRAEKKLKAGKRLEKVIFDFFLEEFQPDEYYYFSNENLTYRSKIYDFLAGTPDAICIKYDQPYIVEIKNMGHATAKEFQENSIPINYLCQASLYSYLFNTNKFLFAVLIDGYDFRIFGPFDLDKEFLDFILEQARNFLDFNIKQKQPPQPKYLKEVSMIYPKSKSLSIEANDEILETYNRLVAISNQIKELEEKKEQLNTVVANYMKDNEMLTFKGKKLVRFKSQTQNRFDSNSFKKVHPDLYDKFCKQISFRKFELIKEEE